MIVRNERDRETVLRLINELDISKPQNIIIKQYREPRTISQNKYYWLILKIIGYDTGNSKDELHEVFKAKYIDKIELLGESINGSSKELNTKQFTNYIESIRIFARTDLNIDTPNADDKRLAETYEYYSNIMI